MVLAMFSFPVACRRDQVQSNFKKAGLRVEVDRGAERLAKQIRVAEQVRL